MKVASVIQSFQKLCKNSFKFESKLIELRRTITFSVSSFSPFKRNTTMPR